MEKFQMSSMQSIVSEKFAPEGENSWILPQEEHKQLFNSLLEELVNSSSFTFDFNKVANSN